MVTRYASGIDLAYFVMCQAGTLMIQFVSLTDIVLWKGNRRHCVTLEFRRERGSTKYAFRDSHCLCVPAAGENTVCSPDVSDLKVGLQRWNRTANKL